MERVDEWERKQIHSEHEWKTYCIDVLLVTYTQPSRWNDIGFQPSCAVTSVKCIFSFCEKSTTHIFLNLTIWNINKQCVVVVRVYGVFLHCAIWCTHFLYGVCTYAQYSHMGHKSQMHWNIGFDISIDVMSWLMDYIGMCRVEMDSHHTHTIEIKTEIYLIKFRLMMKNHCKKASFASAWIWRQMEKFCFKSIVLLPLLLMWIDLFLSHFLLKFQSSASIISKFSISLFSHPKSNLKVKKLEFNEMDKRGARLCCLDVSVLKFAY